MIAVILWVLFVAALTYWLAWQVRLLPKKREVRNMWDGLDPADLRGWVPPGEPTITAADEAWLRKELK